MRRPWLSASLLASMLVVGGCASVDPYRHAPIATHLQRADSVGDCARLFQRSDRSIDAAGVRDAMSPRVPGFPYLRIDRFNAGLAPQAKTEQQGDAWRIRLHALDREARAFELRNLAGDSGATTATALEDCRATLHDADRPKVAALAEAARVPDDYSAALRVLGLYPITKLLFAAGIRRWHAETLEEFALPLERLPQLGALRRYAPAPPVALDRAGSAELARDVLGVPQLVPAHLEQLIARHAPLYEIDTADENDRIGALAWAAGPGGRPGVSVDVAQPSAYARIAHTRLGGRVHLQLIYTVWFAARPPQGAFDVLAGRLDGLLWRVTLGSDLEPLAYDTIHPCGCFHLFFPTARVRVRERPIEGEGPFDESVFVPQTITSAGAGQRLLLRLAARSHYVQRVLVIDEAAAAAPPAAVRYALHDEDELRALPIAPASGTEASAPELATRSVYGENGLIAGSQRLERFFFWPMGIESAGQMRQWGRHATAFVGRRHFDDPRLLDRYFEVRGSGAPTDQSSPSIEAALEQARRAAGGKDVSLGGGANAARQYLAAGLVGEMQINVVPTLLGSGERLFDSVGDDLHGLELVRTVAAPR
jgi:hypothetical protein